LLSSGNSVIVIEHHPEFIRCADHVIDLGPEGGKAGGHLVASGSVAEIMAAPASYTGRMLRELFGGDGQS